VTVSGERILVTGGAGYVGSQTCALLADAGYVPVVLDNLSRGHEDLVKWGDLEVGDICDAAFLDKVLGNVRPAAVMHFAALAYVGESMCAPEIYFRNNVIGGLTLLEAMRRHDVSNIVFASTCATYGETGSEPISETTPQHPVNPYGYTKLAMEQAIAAYQQAHGLNAIILRYFNVAGADPEGRCGERHDPEPHIIPNAISTAYDKQRSFELYGDDYPTPDGTCVRDYVHVHDIARAHVLGLERLLSGGRSLTANLANGQGYSVREIISAVGSVTGRSVPLDIHPRRAGDPAVLVADASFAKAAFGWSPNFPDVRQMIVHAVEWARADGQI